VCKRQLCVSSQVVHSLLGETGQHLKGWEGEGGFGDRCGNCRWVAGGEIVYCWCTNGWVTRAQELFPVTGGGGLNDVGRRGSPESTFSRIGVGIETDIEADRIRSGG